MTPLITQPYRGRDAITKMVKGYPKPPPLPEVPPEVLPKPKQTKERPSAASVGASKKKNATEKKVPPPYEPLWQREAKAAADRATCD
mmetsp:Transcript_85629/g.171001  ORF Transcript_85629/g.171001 Transcript_85629/m.171001 type:complete len:87 (-) Transcript_85629:74-334(-)